MICDRYIWKLIEMQRASYEYEEPCCQTNSKCVRLHLCPDTVVVSGIIDCEAFTDTTTKN